MSVVTKCLHNFTCLYPNLFLNKIYNSGCYISVWKNPVKQRLSIITLKYFIRDSLSEIVVPFCL